MSSDERPEGYFPLTTENLFPYLQSLPQDIKSVLLSDWSLFEDKNAITLEEIGDGNLNSVFVVLCGEDRGSFVVKQALPWLKKYQSWPLTLNRADVETRVLRAQYLAHPDHVPRVLHFDPKLKAIFMPYLHPHVVLRHGLIKGLRFPKFGEHLGLFLARTLFATSDFHLAPPAKKELVGTYVDNWPLCQLTEQVIFTEPYRDSPNNRWTTPQLDQQVAEIKSDIHLRVRVGELKRKFISCSEALIHGDLHTGSVMVTEADTKVIDPEFGYVGPMGFDIGMILANLLMAYFSHLAHSKNHSDPEAYPNWILENIQIIWDTFRLEFLTLWSKEKHFGPEYHDLKGELNLAQAQFIDQLLKATFSFAGAEMIRRIIGVAHLEDFELIEDPTVRACCEGCGLTLSHPLVLGEFDSIEMCLAKAKQIFREKQKS